MIVDVNVSNFPLFQQFSCVLTNLFDSQRELENFLGEDFGCLMPRLLQFEFSTVKRTTIIQVGKEYLRLQVGIIK